MAADTSQSKARALVPRARSGFRPDFAEQAQTLAQSGATEIEIADILGISRATLAEWKLQHPEFGRALAVGKEPADERVLQSLYQRALGFRYVEQQAVKVKVGPHEERVEVVEVERFVPGDAQACTTWLKNRRPAEWRDKPDPALDRRDGDTIFAQITVDQVIARLKTVDDAC